ncbi:MAG: sugar phosphate isomerase/epimerase family protein [Bryobacteraceae bacterium]
MSRRAFLISSAIASRARANDRAPAFAVQVYVWTQHYERLNDKASRHYGDILAACASAGYRHVELLSDWFTLESAERTMDLLRQNKLTSPIVYNGGPMHNGDGAQSTIAATLALARRIRSVNPSLVAISFNASALPRRERKSDAELEIQAQAINRLGDELAKEKVRLFVHQHDPEMRENAREWRYMLAHTNPKTVEVCLDTHWVFRGGQDVMTHLKEAGPRLASLHLRNSRDKIWLDEFAAGDIDYGEVARFLKSIRYRGYLVVELAWDRETRITRPLDVNLKRSLEYARKVFG